MAKRDSMTLDTLDEQLLNLLEADPRQTNRKLAELTGTSEITVANRIRRMSTASIARVVGSLEWHSMGDAMAFVALIRVNGRPVLEVADDLKTIAECRSVSAVRGAVDIVATFSVRDPSHLRQVLESKIYRVPAVVTVEASLLLDTIGFRETWARLP